MSGAIRTVVTFASLGTAGYFYLKYRETLKKFENIENSNLKETSKRDFQIIQIPDEIVEEKKEIIIDENKVEKVLMAEKTKIIQETFSPSEKAKNLLFDENFRLKRRFI
jgi:hypothetical protein